MQNSTYTNAQNRGKTKKLKEEYMNPKNKNQGEIEIEIQYLTDKLINLNMNNDQVEPLGTKDETKETVKEVEPMQGKIDITTRQYIHNTLEKVEGKIKVMIKNIYQ